MRKTCQLVAMGLVCVGIGWMMNLTGGTGEIACQPSSPTPMPVTVVPYYGIPDRMELCGEPVPLDDPEVRERFDREFTIVVYGHAQVYLWLKRMERYFPAIEKELARGGLPNDLKYVAVAESDLMATACSPAGAVGPWQFIASTGSNYGLDQSAGLDERHDFEMATESAFRYLRDLRGLFNNWTLAIAAYNCGEKRVQDEIRRQGVSSYYGLRLPQETERYIFRILAVKEVLSHPERYGYALPKGAGYAPLRLDRVSVQIPNALPIREAAEAAGVTYRQFKVYNPVLTSDSLPAGAYALRVPEGRGREFLSRLEVIKPSYKPSVRYHKVGRGESLSGIAARYKVEVKELRAWNQIQGNRVRNGQVLKLLQ